MLLFIRKYINIFEASKFIYTIYIYTNQHIYIDKWKSKSYIILNPSLLVNNFYAKRIPIFFGLCIV